jgi:preprotein translocase subunit SecY
VLVVYRLGCNIPVPFVDPDVLKLMVGTTTVGMGAWFNMISGGAFSQATLFALGVIPYINSSIIITLLTVAIPYLENLSKQGEEGRKQIAKITRYVAVGISLVLAIGYYFILKRIGAILYTDGMYGFFAAVVIIIGFVAGTMFLMWMGEQIDKKGIGNGVSLIIFTGIISRFGNTARTFYVYLLEAINGDKKINFVLIPLYIIFAIVVVAFSVVLNNAERRIPIQYAKSVAGRKMMGGQSTHLPIKVNMSGVMPVIFASSLVSIPGTIRRFFTIESEIVNKIIDVFDVNGFVYSVIYVVLIILFNYFYVSMQYNPMEIANNLRKNNGTIPGYRPGKATQDYITKVLGNITFIGAVFLGVVAILPIITGNLTGQDIQMGGTSVLIIVGVALEVSQRLEAQMVSRHYSGFLR